MRNRRGYTLTELLFGLFWLSLLVFLIVATIHFVLKFW